MYLLGNTNRNKISNIEESIEVKVESFNLDELILSFICLVHLCCSGCIVEIFFFGMIRKCIKMFMTRISLVMITTNF